MKGSTPAVQVTKVCQPLDDLRDVASSDSVDTFVLSYTSLLQVGPQIHIQHVICPSLLQYPYSVASLHAAALHVAGCKASFMCVLDACEKGLYEI